MHLYRKKTKSVGWGEAQGIGEKGETKPLLGIIHFILCIMKSERLNMFFKNKKYRGLPYNND